jgi:hypothetical protein
MAKCLLGQGGITTAFWRIAVERKLAAADAKKTRRAVTEALPSCRCSPRPGRIACIRDRRRYRAATVDSSQPGHVYRDRVAALSDALADHETRAEAFDTIRSLIDEIRLVPDGDKLRIDLRGELAGILSIAANSKKPGSLATVGQSEQIKMVSVIEHVGSSGDFVSPSTELWLLYEVGA